ncbi:hypothetical protein JCM8115_003280 [Rhodotorula mucilaginosa]
MMRYRLPLELELMILELAAPPLAIDRLHARLRFFINVSLVHRSLTAWAQERLHDQFLYTYRRRSDEHERLKARFEAGFGRDRPLCRLYLDLSRLPAYVDRRKGCGSDSVSATINGRAYGAVSSPGGPGKLEQAQGRACEAVAHYVQNGTIQVGKWKVCAMIKAFSQALDTLWLNLPVKQLDIAGLPQPRLGGYATRHMIFHRCWAIESDLRDVLNRFPHIETLVFFETEVEDLVSKLTALPTPIRRVHILEHNVEFGGERYSSQHVLPHLESFTYTSLSSGESAPQTPEDDGPDQNALAEVQQAVESILDAPQCAFKDVRSTQSPEDALADALATLELDL